MISFFIVAKRPHNRRHLRVYVFPRERKKLNTSRLLVIVISVTSLYLSALASAQNLSATLSPAIIEQLKSLSPEEQRRYAEQYGITLPSTPPTSSSEFLLAAPGEELTSALDAANYLDGIDLAEPVSTEEETPLRFGRDVFSNEVSTFAPTDNAPVPDSYRLGVGDTLNIQLFGKENDQFELQIGRSGEVLFPTLGPMTLSGLSFEDARALITNRVSEELIGVSAVVGMGRLRAINIFMAGEVESPGAYSVSALTTVTQAIYQAGGISEIGSLRAIQVRRNGAVVATFDAYDLLLAGDASNDIRLSSGDVVYVPPYEADIEVRGAVKRPMIYELVGDESLGEVLAMAGSYIREAFPAATLITRKNGKLGLQGAQTLDLTLDQNLALPAYNGDVVTVPAISEQISNSISLKGAVARPGVYGWVEGLRLSQIIGDARRDLLPNADLSLGMIVRQKNALLDIEVISFEVDEALKSPNSAADPILSEFDEILIFSLVTADISETDTEGLAEQKPSLDKSLAQLREIEFEEEEEEQTDRITLLEPVIIKLRSQARQNEPVQVVSVSGAVRAPGDYPLTENATIQSLVSAAGGLKDSAFLEAAELRRIQVRSGGEVSADYREINLTRVRGGLNFSLSSRDHLTVREVPDWSPNETVTIEGEVKFPGEYRIRKGERLSDIIRRAGSLTEDASPDAAIFTRKEIAEQENIRATEFKREIQSTFASRLLTEETTSQSIADISTIIDTLDQVDSEGRLLIDLSAALAGDTSADLYVSDGDRLVIPKTSNTVTVVGEVNRAGTHTFRESFSLEDYVELSAGLTRRADDGGIYIVKANGSVVTLEKNLWRFTARNSNLDPGDTIVVPINTQYKESLASWREITQIIYQSMVSVAAVARL